MGAAERVNRRKVLTAATDAVTKTNYLVGRYNDCVRAIAEQRDRIESLEAALAVAKADANTRFDAQGAWVGNLETSVKANREEAAADARVLNGLIEAEVSDRRERLPESNTFRGRLIWLFKGI